MLISTSDMSPICSAYFSTQTCAIYLPAKDTFIRRLATRDSLTCPKRFHYKKDKKALVNIVLSKKNDIPSVGSDRFRRTVIGRNCLHAIYLPTKDIVIRRLVAYDLLTCPERFHYKEDVTSV